eukprot:1789814-Alexandrium_andersonii.AAC.1
MSASLVGSEMCIRDSTWTGLIDKSTTGSASRGPLNKARGASLGSTGAAGRASRGCGRLPAGAEAPTAASAPFS